MGRGKKSNKWSRKVKAERAAERSGENNNRKNVDSRSEKEKQAYQTGRCMNKKLETYYALQNLHNMRFDEEKKEFVNCVTDEEKEEERQRWVKALGSILPASFRLGQDIDDDLRDGLEQQLDEFVGKEFEITVSTEEGLVVNNRNRKIKEVENKNNQEESGENNENVTSTPMVETTTKMVAPARKIQFIPHGYQLSVDRRTIRRNKSLEVFHQWLVRQSDAGFLTRQETVSMIPPVVLDPQPHHAVLDMCAAPGSKTSQLLEIVGVVANKEDDEPKGFVVANDSDVQRAYMLVSQIRRLNSPSIFVTSCDAQRFPLQRQHTAEDIAREGIFDRVLADVPCSGDGTARKNMGIWRHWNQGGSIALHPLQLSIALNGARLTKVGGYICYSTCSMNPMENESVVAELLRATDGSLELVDKRPDMPGLLARPGWNTWHVLVESKRNRELKNKQKKNNAKMQARRRLWAEKNKQSNESHKIDGKKDENGTNDESIAATKTNDKKEENGTETTTTESDKAKDESVQSNTEKEEEEWIREPPSWEQDFLLERIKSLGLTHYPTFEDVPKDSQRRVRKSMFPPTKEEASKFHLERCLRCLPHDMDTGGFFVALLKKVKPLSERARKKMDELDSITDLVPNKVQEKRKSKEVLTTNDNDATTSECKKPKVESNETDTKDETSQTAKDSNGTINSDKKEEDQQKMDAKDIKKETDGKGQQKQGRRHVDLGGEKFIPCEPSIFPEIVDFFGLKDSFPKDQFMARANGDAKVLYFISKSIKSKLIDKGMQERVTVINSGLRAFERGSREVCPSKYRPVQEAVHFIAPHMSKRKLVADVDNFCICFASGAIPISKFPSKAFAEQVRSLDLGSFVVVLEGYENDVALKMMCVMWRCRGDNINCLVSKKEMLGMKSKVSALTGNTFDTEDSETKTENPNTNRNNEENADVAMFEGDNSSKGEKEATKDS